MKKSILVIAALCAAGTLAAQGRLLRGIDFETTGGIRKYPDDSVLELDDENPKQGKKSIVFTPDNNCTLYFWQKLAGGHEYIATFQLKMDKKPIKRNSFSLSYAKAGGKNGSAGRQTFSLSELAPADGQWHECTVKFTAPADAVRAQVMLDLYRTNAVVNIDDFKLFDTHVAKSVEKGTAVSRGTLVKSVDFSSAGNLIAEQKQVGIRLQKMDGRDAIVFTPDANYNAYFYQPLAPGKYTVEFDWKADDEPIKRCALVVYFTSQGGKRADLGKLVVPLASLGKSEGGWLHAAIPAAVPEKIGKNCQIILAMFRANTRIAVSDLKIYKEAE